MATRLADLVKPIPYPDIYQPEDPDYHPTAVVRTMFVDHVDRDAAHVIVEHLEASDAAMRVAQLRVLGGAVARVPVKATAYAHRGSRIMLNVATFYDGAADRAVRNAWAVAFADALRQDDTGAYVNFLGDDGPDRIREAYPDATWDRLTVIKRRYDPTNHVPRQPKHPTGKRPGQRIEPSAVTAAHVSSVPTSRSHTSAWATDADPGRPR